ncbi:NADP-dependent malic enzyme [Candidatus Microgenomates bacterium]|nr:NADP-dependent malic enzyme [Candidatus Microgenomates bacterium]
MDYNRKALLLHKKLAGKITVSSKIPVKSRDQLSTLYTPGVGAVSSAIAKDKNLVWELTGRGNSVAIVSNGTAILGLGNIGPEAGLPVMEGKAVLFNEFGGVNAYPLCISADNTQDIVNFVKMITPSVGGINLEDIAAPVCFEVEEKLKDLGIPVFHDDQDGAAIAVLAALVNATRVLGKKLSSLKVVILGAGASGSATTWLLAGREKWQAHKKISDSWYTPPADIIVVDSHGIISDRRADLTTWKKMLATITNKERKSGDLATALKGADVVIGLSTGGKITKKQITVMNKNPIVFALSNPVPEIRPEEAYQAGAVLVATGRSDYPNQINNALVFPGLFRGLLDSHTMVVTPQIKLAVARTLAESVTPTKNNILPSVLNKEVHQKVALAVKKAL